jgi:hypothetical protein
MEPPMACESDALVEVVRHYLATHAPRRRAERDVYESQPTLEHVIRLAARCEDARGKRRSHQRRIPKAALAALEQRLLAQRGRLLRARTFEDLHGAIEHIAGPIEKIGELTVYDVALRIAPWLRLTPALVYLHAGTRVGAEKLGLDVSGKTLDPKELPRAFAVLRADEVEDVLCIYKKSFEAKDGEKSCVGKELAHVGSCDPAPIGCA